MRRAERQAYFQARRHGERYCHACGTYRVPSEFTGAGGRACDYCRGAHRCSRCGGDQPVVDFVAIDADEVCETCRSYRPLTQHEGATFAAFLADDEPVAPNATDDSVILGRDSYGRPVHLASTTRSQHLYLIGNAVSGKETLLKNLFVEDMIAGRGCALIDLKGELALHLLGSVPPARLPVVNYFAPATGHGPMFNPLALPYPPQEVAEDMLEALNTFFPDDVEPGLENLLRFGLLTLLGDRGPHTLADLYNFYVAPAYRAAIAEVSPSPRLRAFWQHEIGSVERGLIDRIVRTLATFLTPLSPAERLFSTTENGLDFKALMESRQIFIANLSCEVIGREPARLIGVLLTRAIARAAHARSVPVGSGPADFFLYVPDFHDYASPECDRGFAGLAQAGVSLTFSDRSFTELPAAVADAIVANVGALAAFAVDEGDATRLEPEMATRCLCRASTGVPYDHDAARRAAAAPVRAAVHEELASAVLFVGESQPNYEGSRIDGLMAEVDRANAIPMPTDLGAVDWPTVTDLMEQRPMAAFVRFRDAKRTVAFTVEPPSAVDEQARARILDRPHRRELAARGLVNQVPAGAQPQRYGRPPRRRRIWRRAFRRRPRRTR